MVKSKQTAKKPVIVKAKEASKALEALFKSKPAPEPVAAPVTLPAAIAKIVEETEMKRGRKPVGELPVKELVLKLFESDADKEWSVANVIEKLKHKNPGINENSIRFMTTELKKESKIHSVRNEGHYQILKFSKPGEAKAFPAAKLDKPTTKSALKVTPAAVESDLAVLEEAKAVILKLTKLVQRNQEALAQLARLKSVL